MKRGLGLLFLLLLTYCILLSAIFGRPISLSISSQISILGLSLEVVGLLLSVYFVSQFYKKYGLHNTLSFFVPLFLAGAVVEGDWIVKQRFTFHKLNFYLWDVPIVIILYYSGAYLLYFLYQNLGKGFINRAKGLIIHLLVDSLVTTPLAVLCGFWTFRSTLLTFYPYIVPAVHLGEVSLGLFYVVFQEKLIAETRVDTKLKPIISLTTIFCLLLIYAITNQFLDKLI